MACLLTDTLRFDQLTQIPIFLWEIEKYIYIYIYIYDRCIVVCHKKQPYDL